MKTTRELEFMLEDDLQAHVDNYNSGTARTSAKLNWITRLLIKIAARYLNESDIEDFIDYG